MKKIIIILLLLFALPTLAYYNPGQPGGFINDYTDTLTNEQKQALENKLSQFKKETGNEIAVVLIPSLKEDMIENFAVKLFEDWKIGKQGKDNGVLVLVAKEDREMKIEVGYGLEGALTDAQSYWIINQVMQPAFRNNDFYGGLDGTVDKIIAATKGEIIPGDNKSQSSSSGKFNPFDFFWFGIFIFVWLASILGRSKSWWAGGIVGAVIGLVIGVIKGFLFFGVIAIGLLIPLGLLFDFIVSKKYQAGKAGGYIPWWIGGGRGGPGGGFGGGFGGFGGGHSGGGGASGRW